MVPTSKGCVEERSMDEEGMVMILTALEILRRRRRRRRDDDIVYGSSLIILAPNEGEALVFVCSCQPPSHGSRHISMRSVLTSMDIQHYVRRCLGCGRIGGER